MSEGKHIYNVTFDSYVDGEHIQEDNYLPECDVDENTFWDMFSYVCIDPTDKCIIIFKLSELYRLIIL